MQPGRSTIRSFPGRIPVFVPAVCDIYHAYKENRAAVFGEHLSVDVVNHPDRAILAYNPVCHPVDGILGMEDLLANRLFHLVFFVSLSPLAALSRCQGPFFKRKPENSAYPTTIIYHPSAEINIGSANNETNRPKSRWAGRLQKIIGGAPWQMLTS